MDSFARLNHVAAVGSSVDRPYRIVFLGIGTLLIAAALLKTHQLATIPTPPSAWLSPTVMVFVVQGELLLGILLSAGVAPRGMWWTSLCAFGVFAVVSLLKGLLGHDTCGCFGRVELSPWWTFLIDLVAIGSLLTWRPSSAPHPDIGNVVSTRPANAPRLASAFLVYVAIGAPVGFVMASFEPQRLIPGVLLEDSGIVLLEPETWLGKEFPLVSFIENGQPLQTGHWTVVLLHHDCPKCQEVVPIYESLARDSGEHSPRIALIELPPFGLESAGINSSCLRTKLSEQYEWFVTTPVEIQLEDGRVVRVLSEPSTFSQIARRQ